MKKKSWTVIASSFMRENGERMCAARAEIVDTENVLFHNCISIIDVKDAYERFWNNLNPNSLHVVFVSEVIPSKF